MHICPRCRALAITVLDSSKPLRFIFRCDVCAAKFAFEIEPRRGPELDTTATNVTSRSQRAKKKSTAAV